MTDLFAPDIKVVAPARPPEIDSQAVAEARRREQERLLLTRRGRGATILSGGGVGTPATVGGDTGRRLLGS